MTDGVRNRKAIGTLWADQPDAVDIEFVFFGLATEYRVVVEHQA